MNAAIVLPERVRHTRAQSGPREQSGPRSSSPRPSGPRPSVTRARSGPWAKYDMSDKDQHIQALKERIGELEHLIGEHANALELAANTIEKPNSEEVIQNIVETMRLARMNTLERTCPEPEDY